MKATQLILMLIDDSPQKKDIEMFVRSLVFMDDCGNRVQRDFVCPGNYYLDVYFAQKWCAVHKVVFVYLSIFRTKHTS